MSDDPYLYVRQARPDLYQEIVAFSSTVNLRDDLQTRASIEKFCMHLVDACKYALVMLFSLLFAGVVEAACNPTPDGKTFVCDNQIPWGVDPAEYKKTCVNCFVDNKAKPKQVIFEYDDVLKMLAKTEHRDKLLNQCVAEKAVLVKLKDEQGKTISIQADQVKWLIETAETQERLGKTEEQINEALQKQLVKVTADLDREKRLSRYKSEAFYLGVAGVIFMMVVN